MEYPGDGFYGHDDGYNVLFGDGHVGWYADPQQELIWMPLDADYAGTQFPMGTNMYCHYSWQTMSFGIGFFHHFDRLVDPDIRWNDKAFWESTWEWGK